MTSSLPKNPKPHFMEDEINIRKTMSKKTSEVEREIEHLIGDRLVVISNGTKATVRFKEAIKAVLDWHTKAVAKEKMELVERIRKAITSCEVPLCSEWNDQESMIDFLDSLKSEEPEEAVLVNKGDWGEMYITPSPNKEEVR